jgi:cephalosporin hydroxylase
LNIKLYNNESIGSIKKNKKKEENISLRNIGSNYGTDKVSHGFCDAYDNKFSKIRSSAKDVLEIGVFFGASILMWRDYFKNATIHGLDTFEGLQGNGHVFKDADKFYKHWENNKDVQERIELYKYDQGKEEDLIAFFNDMLKKDITFDIIIDDASHLMRDQQLTFKHMFPLIKKGGYYVIEDVHSSFGGYDVLSDLSNTTLKMINDYNDKGELFSIYTNLDSLKSEIKNMELFTTSKERSMTCIIEKK